MVETSFAFLFECFPITSIKKRERGEKKGGEWGGLKKGILAAKWAGRMDLTVTGPGPERM